MTLRNGVEFSPLRRPPSEILDQVPLMSPYKYLGYRRFNVYNHESESFFCRNQISLILYFCNERYETLGITPLNTGAVFKLSTRRYRVILDLEIWLYRSGS